jgi:hypothetical protein
VTRAEHERALASTLACAHRAGLEADVARKTTRVAEVSIDSGPLLAGESQGAYDKRTESATNHCLHDYWDDVEEGWLHGTAPSEEERAQAVTQLSACQVRQGEMPLRNEADVKGLQLRLADRMKAQGPLVSPDDAVAARLDRQLGCMSAYRNAVEGGR